MQIILNQAEIEQALRNYVYEIISVNAGMTVSVTIKATRGEEGTTAVVDILPEIELVALEPTPAVEKPPRQGRQPRVKAEPVAEVVAATEVLVAEAGVVVEPQANGTVVLAEAVVDPVVPDEEVEAPLAEPTPDPVVADPAPVTKPTSLFSGLKRPNNG